MLVLHTIVASEDAKVHVILLSSIDKIHASFILDTGTKKLEPKSF